MKLVTFDCIRENSYSHDSLPLLVNDDLIVSPKILRTSACVVLALVSCFETVSAFASAMLSLPTLAHAQSKTDTSNTVTTPLPSCIVPSLAQHPTTPRSGQMRQL